jgi:hypothetical protein
MLAAHGPVYMMGCGFPWGLLIIGGILYLLWRNGAFGGPGRRDFGPGQHFRGYGGYPPAPAPGQPEPQQDWSMHFRGPRDLFEEWHRQAHAAGPQQPPAQPAPPAPPAGQTPAPGNGETSV